MTESFAYFCPCQDLETAEIFVKFCLFQESGTTDIFANFYLFQESGTTDVFVNFCPFQDLETAQVFVKLCPFQESETAEMFMYFCSILIRLYSHFACVRSFCPSIISICMFLWIFFHVLHIFCLFQGAKSKKMRSEKFQHSKFGVPCRVGSCRHTPNNALALRASKYNHINIIMYIYINTTY